MKVNDFFCGAGGFGLGFKQAGWSIAGGWDWNEYAVKTYRRNVHPEGQLADITELHGTGIPQASCWTYGFPCQDISVAGTKKGFVVVCERCETEYTIKDPADVCPTCQANVFRAKSRSGMFFEIMRLLSEVRQKPEIIVAENVKQLKNLLPILKAEYYKAGYVMYVKLYNSKFWGVPQNRERYFVVGVRKDLDVGYFRFPKEQTEFVPKLSSVLETDVPEKFYLKDEKAAKIIELALSKYKHPQEAYVDKDGCALACNACYYKGASYTDVLKKRNTQIVEEPHLKEFGSLEYYKNDQMNRVYDVEGIAPTVLTVSGGGREIKIMEVPKFRVRRLTPREYARLQGFPDDFVFECSDTRIYEQMGNAVTVSVAKAVAEACGASARYHAGEGFECAS